MPDLYARQLADLGYTAFTFDFSGFGESEGEPRQAEMRTARSAI
jgi:alpha/beta superfamily hydrolase